MTPRGKAPGCGMRLQDDALIEDIIDRLLDVRTGRPGKQVALSETEVPAVRFIVMVLLVSFPRLNSLPPPTRAQIRQLCLTAKEIFMSQPNLLELEAPIKICGEPCVMDLPSNLFLHSPCSISS